MRLRPVTRLRVRLENLLAIWTKLFPVCRESPPICKRCARERRAQADDKGNELAVEINFRSRSVLTETESSAYAPASASIVFRAFGLPQSGVIA